MSIRQDLTIEWTVSPRIIEIASPSIEITVQDLYDTLRDIASKAEAIDDDEIVDGSGKEALGGGLLIGLTVKLLNAKLKFEARSNPPWIICDIRGGNLIAVDGNGNSMSPMEPSAYVMITKTSSVSAALLGGLAITEKDRNAIADAVWQEDLSGHWTENVTSKKAASFIRFLFLRFFGRIEQTTSEQRIFKGDGTNQLCNMIIGDDGNKLIKDKAAY